MRRPLRIEQVFRGDDDGVTIRRYEVHVPLAPPRRGDECVRLVDLCRAERALALAAMTDGMTSSYVLRFARKALDLTVEMLAQECSVSAPEARAWERVGLNATNPGEKDVIDDIIALLEQSDHGDRPARRCL